MSTDDGVGVNVLVLREVSETLTHVLGARFYSEIDATVSPIVTRWAAHPQMRELAILVVKSCVERFPTDLRARAMLVDLLVSMYRIDEAMELDSGRQPRGLIPREVASAMVASSDTQTLEELIRSGGIERLMAYEDERKKHS